MTLGIKQHKLFLARQDNFYLHLQITRSTRRSEHPLWLEEETSYHQYSQCSIFTYNIIVYHCSSMSYNNLARPLPTNYWRCSQPRIQISDYNLQRFCFIEEGSFPVWFSLKNCCSFSSCVEKILWMFFLWKYYHLSQTNNEILRS